jgi:antitoxin component YwqK of YwqJK toxin-antitoxin module
MKKLALILVLCLAATGYAQEKEYTVGVNSFEVGIFSSETEYIIQDSNGKPVTGLVKWYLKRDGKITEKIWKITPYKSGKAEGMGKRYKESGKIDSETPYKNGKAEGLSKTYYENGRILFETPYKNGKKEGISMMYSESGKLEAEVLYTNGHREGIAKYYLQNGAVMEIQHRNDIVVSGFCINTTGTKIPLTNPEISRLNNWFFNFDRGEICE